MAALIIFPAPVASAAFAQTPGPTPATSAKVIAIVDGDTLRLDSGQQVRLVGLQAPKLPLGRKNFKAWPLGAEAKAALAELTLDKRIQLSYGGRKSDRHGRLLAHLHDGNGRWIQGELLRMGFARVYSFPDNRSRVREMLTIEREARRAERGIWALDFYRIRHADRLRGTIDTFQIVEGRIRDIATVRGRTYLNFGADWRTDFTISVSRADRRRFERNSIGEMKGRLVRVRGWISWRNGPMIDATHPEQIEVIE